LALLVGSGTVLPVGGQNPPVSSAAAPDAPPVEMVDMPSSLTGMAEWAVDLFDEAGLELPPLRFVHHGDDLDACNGKPGRHRSVDGISVVHLCTSEPSFPTRIVILHETAHAWAAHSLSREREADFQELRGWDHWLDYEASPWFENGSEQAAEIMVWGLLDRPIRIITIEQNSCDELDVGFRTLTGTAPLHGFRDLCGERQAAGASMLGA
jgi:hypothetical protein